MTLQERLNRRLDLIHDFKIIVDEKDDMCYFPYNRKLDLSLTFLKHLTKSRFNTLLNEAQEVWIKYHKEP